MELNEWNPMEEDYYSSAFNSYDRSQGLRIPIDLYPSWKNNKKTSKETIHTVSLYITGIPLKIDEKGLKLIFSNYGKVLRSYRGFPKDSSINTCFGFIDYETIKEAELAMRELDGKPPYNLQVTFAKSGKEKEDQLIIKERELFSFLEKSLHLNDKKCSSEIDQERYSVIKLKGDTKILPGVFKVNCSGNNWYYDLKENYLFNKSKLTSESMRKFNKEISNSEKHRYIIKERIPSILRTLHSEQEIELVIIKTFPDKFAFWALIYNKDILMDLYEMEKSFKETAPCNEIKPKIGDIIVAQSSANKEWYRAYVLNEKNGNLKVRYIDYANEEEITVYKTASFDILNVISPTVYCIVEDDTKFNQDKFKKLLVNFKSVSVKIQYADSSKAYLSLLTIENELINNIKALPWYFNLPSYNSFSTDIYCENRQLSDKTEFKRDSMQNQICWMSNDLKKLFLCDFDNSEVKIVSLDNLCKLFVQPISFEKEIDALVKEITLYCENLSITSYVPKINQIVCAKFSEDNLWYRGYVIEPKSSTSFLIHFVDFGKKEEIDCHFLRPLPEQFIKNHIYCIKVAIENFPSIFPTFEIQQLLFKQLWTMKIINIENSVVKLFNSDGKAINEIMKEEILINETEDNFNYKLINDTNEIIDTDLKKITKIYYYEDCDFLQLPTGEINIIITSIVTPEAIFCHIADSNSFTALVNLNNDISSYCMNNPFNDYYPACGEICLARYSDDGLWYRAVPLKITRGKLQMFFIDFGNIEILDFEDTRQMISQFMELPIQAVHCMLSGISSQNWNTEVIEELLKILPQKEELTVKVLEKIQKNNDVIYILDIPFITDHLIKTELVKCCSEKYDI